MANVLVTVKGGRVISVDADEHNIRVRVLDQDAENEVTNMRVIVGGDLYEKHMLDLGYAGFHVGDTVVVSNDWQGTIVGFKKESSQHFTDVSRVLAQVEDQEGNVFDVDVEYLVWD